jgi:hypothetical protein
MAFTDIVKLPGSVKWRGNSRPSQRLRHKAVKRYVVTECVHLRAYCKSLSRSSRTVRRTLFMDMLGSYQMMALHLQFALYLKGCQQVRLYSRGINKLYKTWKEIIAASLKCHTATCLIELKKPIENPSLDYRCAKRDSKRALPPPPPNTISSFTA